MADKKISQLTSATTPLAGTEVLPIVQSGSTVKVSIDNVTKGRTVNATTFDTDVAAAGVTLAGTTLSADGTDSNIDVNVTPKGTGSVNMTKVNIDGGTIDGTTIGGASAAAATVTTLNASGNVSLDGGTFVFNDSGADKDFRVEGDNSAYLIYTKAASDYVGLNTSAPIRLLTLGGGKDMLFLNTAGDGATNTVLGRVSSNVRSYGGNIGTASFATMEFATDATDWYKGEIRFLTNSTDGTDGAGTTRMKIGANGNITVSTGNLVVGTSGKGIIDTNGNESMLFTATASAVNELTVANAATGSNPAISSTGGDTNIGLRLNTKGSGPLSINGPLNRFVASGTNADTTVAATISFVSQSTDWISQLIEFRVALSSTAGSSVHGGVVRYILSSLDSGTGLASVTALASDLTGVTAATSVSGNNLTVTFTITGGGNCNRYGISAEVLSSNGAGWWASGMTVA